MREIGVRGIGLWTAGVSDWAQARDAMTGQTAWPEATASRPAPSLIHANERRRAPDSVLLALAVAEQACTAGGVDPRTIPSVFASMYGDLAINDYLCNTLASDPATLSPTKFHNSVHNAPSGYWGIATGAMLPTTAIAGFLETFAIALLESVSQLDEDQDSVLLVAYDTNGYGPMAEFARSSQAFGCALLLDRDTSASESRLLVQTAPVSGEATSSPQHSALTMLGNTNPIARVALPLLEALVTRSTHDVRMRLSPALDLLVQVRP